jgi:predicted kinase
VLLVINGAPGVGKSTLGRLYSRVHPLSLVIDIDSIRTQLGRWEELDESRQIARDLAVALVRAHLGSGHVVIVPQFIGRPEFVERLRLVAAESGVRFVEVVLTDDSDAVVDRFRLRRNELDAAGGEHPQSDLADDAIASEVAGANDQLLLDAASRGAFVLSGSGGPEESCRSLQNFLGRATDQP